MDKAPLPASPEDYIASLTGWQRAQVLALRVAVRESPALEERVKWGHLVYFADGPVLLIRAEPSRVLFGFWRGQRLRRIEARLKPGGRFEMATLALAPDTPLDRPVVLALVAEAVALNRRLGDPMRSARGG